MEYQDIVVSSEDGVGTIRINRPHAMNAGTGQTWAEMNRALDGFERDASVRVVVLTGTGRAFCAGDDVKELFQRRLEGDLPEPDVAAEAEALRRHEPVGLDRLVTYPKPTIAAVNGVAVGYGCDIALMCDFRIAARSARLGEVFIRRGLIPESGGLLILPLLVGWEKAHELVLTGEIIDAEEACRIGMVGRVVADEELMDATRELAARLMAGAPLAQRMAKEGFRLAREGTLAQFFDYQRKAQELMFRSADHREGVRSFLEKREPNFTGH
ncbi:MAG TPA: enoyl-CoA hydratase/isomerase family protein [Dehalococcoidia bacterium]